VELGEQSLLWMARHRERQQTLRRQRRQRRLEQAHEHSTNRPRTWSSATNQPPAELPRSAALGAASEQMGQWLKSQDASPAASPASTRRASGGEAQPAEQRSVFGAVGLSFAPLYECVHIYRTLGDFGALRQSYTARRREELLGAELELREQLSAEGLPPEAFAAQFIEQVEHYFQLLAGFFVLEDAVLHSGTAAVNGAAAVDQLWSAAVRQCAALLAAGFRRLPAAPDMLRVKRAADIFIALLAAHDFYVDPLLTVLEQTRKPFEKALLRLQEEQLRATLEAADWSPLVVERLADWNEYIEPHRPSLLAEPDMPVPELPVVFGFSAVVVATLHQTKAMVRDYDEYASEWPAFAARLTAIVNKLFCTHLAAALEEVLPADNRNIYTAVQVTADVRMLLGGCTELEEGIREHLDAQLAFQPEPARRKQDERPLAPARRALEESACENEDIIMQQMNLHVGQLMGRCLPHPPASRSCLYGLGPRVGTVLSQ
jgi:hypothetical protein